MAADHANLSEPQLLTITELSERSRFSVTQIRRLVKFGRISVLQPGGKGGKLLFRPDALFSADVPSETSSSEPKVRPKSGRKPGWM